MPALRAGYRTCAPAHRAQDRASAAEEHPAHHDDQQHVGVLRDARKPRQSALDRPQPFNRQEQSPCHIPQTMKVPAGAMPGAAQQEHDPEIACRSARCRRDCRRAERRHSRETRPTASCASAARNPDRGGAVRIVEVLRKAEPEHARHSDSHVGIAGEIKIDLQAEAEHCEPHCPDRQIGRSQRRKDDRRPRRSDWQSAAFSPTPLQSGQRLVEIIE